MIVRILLAFVIGTALGLALVAKFRTAEADRSSLSQPTTLAKSRRPLHRVPKRRAGVPGRIRADSASFEISGEAPIDIATRNEDVRTMRSYIMSTLEAHNELRGASVIYGDLNRDGFPDAAVSYSVEPTGGNFYEEFLSVFLRSGNKLYHTADMSIGAKGRGNASMTSISDNAIYLDTLKKADDDPDCCPSIKGTDRVVLSDNGLIQVSNTASASANSSRLPCKSKQEFDAEQRFKQETMESAFCGWLSSERECRWYKYSQERLQTEAAQYAKAWDENVRNCSSAGAGIKPQF